MDLTLLSSWETSAEVRMLARKQYVEWSRAGGIGVDEEIIPIIRSLNVLEGVTTVTSCASHPSEEKTKFYVVMTASAQGIVHLMEVFNRIQIRLQEYMDSIDIPLNSINRRHLPFPFLVKLEFSNHVLPNPETGYTHQYRSVMLKAKLLMQKQKPKWITLVESVLNDYQSELFKAENQALMLKAQKERSRG